MAKVGIVTDSTNCIPAELIKKYDIHVVPYQLIIDGKSYQDQVDITPADFWKMFKQLKTMPTTGVPSPGTYAEIFTELSKSTDSILCLTLSQALSGALKSAMTAKSMVLEEKPDLKIELIDTRSSVGALGFIVLEAARAAQDGHNLSEIAKLAQDMVPKVKYVASFDSLKYLIRSGRAPKTAVIGDLMGVKPIIGMNILSDTGLVDSLGREKGEKKAMLKLVDLIGDHTDTKKPLHVMVHYTDSIEKGEQLKAMVTSKYDCAELYMSDLTPVMTTHTGPMLGLSFYSSE